MSVSYRIELSSAAKKAIKKLSFKDRSLIAKKIDALASNPRPIGVKKLEGVENLYRIRQGNHRIIYTIEDRFLIIVIVKIGDRKDVYRSYG